MIFASTLGNRIRILARNRDALNGLNIMVVYSKMVTSSISISADLSDSAESPGGDLLGVQLHGVLGEAEPLLHKAGQLTDPDTAAVRTSVPDGSASFGRIRFRILTKKTDPGCIKGSQN